MRRAATAMDRRAAQEEDEAKAQARLQQAEFLERYLQDTI